MTFLEERRRQRKLAQQQQVEERLQELLKREEERKKHSEVPAKQESTPSDSANPSISSREIENTGRKKTIWEDQSPPDTSDNGHRRVNFTTGCPIPTPIVDASPKVASALSFSSPSTTRKAKQSSTGFESRDGWMQSKNQKASEPDIFTSIPKAAADASDRSDGKISNPCPSKQGLAQPFWNSEKASNFGLDLPNGPSQSSTKFSEEPVSSLESPTINTSIQNQPRRRWQRRRLDSSSSEDSFDIMALAELKEKGVASRAVMESTDIGTSSKDRDNCDYYVDKQAAEPLQSGMERGLPLPNSKAMVELKEKEAVSRTVVKPIKNKKNCEHDRQPVESLQSAKKTGLRLPNLYADNREEQDKLSFGPSDFQQASPSNPPSFFSHGDALDELWADLDSKDAKSAKGEKDGAKKKTRKGGKDDPKKNQGKFSNESPAAFSSECKNLRRVEIASSSVFFYHDATNEDGSFNLEPKPSFKDPKFGPFALEPLVLGMDEDGRPHEVPGSIARYLPDYQRKGVQFIYSVITTRRGAILGDDMGLGKTIQTVSLVAALLGKTGTGQDLIDIQNRKKKVDERNRLKQDAMDEAIRNGQIYGVKEEEHLVQNPWAPILVMAPSSVVNNWVTDFQSWGHFAIGTYDKEDNYSGIDAVTEGLVEVLIISHAMFTHEAHFPKLLKVPWKLAVIDEFHLFKNEKGSRSMNIRTLRDQHGTCILGLTGTVMQNNHKELWNLVDIVAKGHLGPWLVFEGNIAKPLKLARTKDATVDVIEMGRKKKEFLKNRLDSIYLRRTKESVLKDELPRKDERVVFCDPSLLQKAIYKHMVQQPDFILLSEAHLPCRCGVNREFFERMAMLRTRDERLDYFRKHKKSVIVKSKCCYKIPTIPGGSGRIDPKAVLWMELEQHANEQPCDRCPFCLAFPALTMLHKVATHIALIQPAHSPETLHPGSEKLQAEKELRIAEAMIPAHIIAHLPGGSLIRQDNIMNDHFALSGKMKVLARLLKTIDGLNGRVLIFSGSTSTLDLIECYVKTTGYSFLRMDGSTPQKKRTELVGEFKSNRDIFLFLLSTKAMGLGLNLTSASWVIIFDVEWNPSYDAQAQDRSYRIGQSQDVKVFRLVSRGTIEEMKYLRQVYKTQLKSETIVEPGSERDAKRMFRGVAGDDNRRGEIFGLANLLRFEENGTFMDYGQEATEALQFHSNVYDMETFLSAAKTIEEDEDTREELSTLKLLEESKPCRQGEDYKPTAKETETWGGESQACLKLCQLSTDSDTEMLGGASQACLEICNNVSVRGSTPSLTAVVSSETVVPHSAHRRQTVGEGSKTLLQDGDHGSNDSTSKNKRKESSATERKESNATAIPPTTKDDRDGSKHTTKNNKPKELDSIGMPPSKVKVDRYGSKNVTNQRKRKESDSSALPPHIEAKKIDLVGQFPNSSNRSKTTFSVCDLYLPSGRLKKTKK